MCGIAGFRVRQPDRINFSLHALARELLLGIDHRGGDATGYVAVYPDGTHHAQKAACNTRRFLEEIDPIESNAITVLCHTRLATQGRAAFPENNHPVRNGKVWATHNGVIYNDREVFEDLGNCKRHGRVDSEAIPALIDHSEWGECHGCLDKLHGSYAIAAVHEEYPGEVFLARGLNSPLYTYTHTNIVVWASTIDTIKMAWKLVVGTPPKDRHIKQFNEGRYMRIDAAGGVRRGSFTPNKEPKVVTATYKSEAEWEAEYEKWKAGLQGHSGSTYIHSGNTGGTVIAAKRKPKLTVADDVARLAQRIGVTAPLWWDDRWGDYGETINTASEASFDNQRIPDDPEVCGVCGLIFDLKDLIWLNGMETCWECLDEAEGMDDPIADIMAECPGCGDMISVIDMEEGFDSTLYCTACLDWFNHVGMEPLALTAGAREGV